MQKQKLQFKATFTKTHNEEGITEGAHNKRFTEYYDRQNKLDDIITLAIDTGIEIFHPNNDNSVIVIIYDGAYPHILDRVSTVISILRRFTEWQKGTWEEFEEKENEY